jgi:hypothetical protein
MASLFRWLAPIKLKGTKLKSELGLLNPMFEPKPIDTDTGPCGNLVELHWVRVQPHGKSCVDKLPDIFSNIKLYHLCHVGTLPRLFCGSQ